MIGKTETDVLVTNWIDFSLLTLFTIGLLCVYPRWTIIQKFSLVFPTAPQFLFFGGAVLLLL